MSHCANLVGKVFAQLTVVNLSSSTEFATYWDCKCSCGNPFLGVREEYLTENKSVSCTSCKQKNYRDSFLIQAQSLYGDKYSFVIPEDFRMGKEITVICKDHGQFLKKPACFLKHPGCKGCLSQKKAELSFKSFLEKASVLHDGFYDYSVSKVSYQSVSSKIDIICPQHGIFNTKASIHLSGSGCPNCIFQNYYHLNPKDFSEKAFKIHGTKYDYSSVEYSGSFKKVSIICKDHGLFEQTPASHFQGSGCPTCSAIIRSYSFVDRYLRDPEKGSKEGFLYLMEVQGNGERFLKVGITTKINKRVNAYRREENYTFTFIKVWTTTRLISAQVEEAVLEWKKFEKLHYWPRKNFDGRSECIQIEHQTKVISRIENLLVDQGYIPER